MKKSIGIQSFSVEKGQKQKALLISQFRNPYEISQPANLLAIPIDLLTSVFLVSPHFVPI